MTDNKQHIVSKKLFLDKVSKLWINKTHFLKNSDKQLIDALLNHKNGWFWIHLYKHNQYNVYRNQHNILILFENDNIISTGYEYVINKDHTLIFAWGKEMRNLYAYKIDSVIGVVD